MLLLHSSACCSASTAKAFRASPSLFSFSGGARNPNFASSVSRRIRTTSGLPVDSDSDGEQNAVNVQRTKYAGVRLEETVDIRSAKLRLDSWISSRISGISRARVQSSIRAGLVHVNGRVVDKVTSILMVTLSEVCAMNSIYNIFFLCACRCLVKLRTFKRATEARSCVMYMCV